MPNKINITLKIGGIVYLSSLFYGNLHSADVIVVTRCANLLISGYLKEYHVTNLLHAVEDMALFLLTRRLSYKFLEARWR